MLNKLLCFIRSKTCWLRGHSVSGHIFQGVDPLTGRQGDYYDQWGNCDHCKKRCHRDIHMYGDATWRGET